MTYFRDLRLIGREDSTSWTEEITDKFYCLGSRIPYHSKVGHIFTTFLGFGVLTLTSLTDTPLPVSSPTPDTRVTGQLGALMSYRVLRTSVPVTFTTYSRLSHVYKYLESL